MSPFQSRSPRTVARLVAVVAALATIAAAPARDHHLARRSALCPDVLDLIALAQLHNQGKDDDAVLLLWSAGCVVGDRGDIVTVTMETEYVDQVTIPQRKGNLYVRTSDLAD